jgi:hypothetical protein
MLEGFNEQEQRKTLDKWCKRKEREGATTVAADAREYFESWALVCRTLDHTMAALKLIDSETLQKAVNAFYVLPDSIVNNKLAQQIRDELTLRR